MSTDALLQITVLRWRDFQHYKNRRVPWVKLYRWLLDDREYRQLSPQARCLLSDLWLLASETDEGVVTSTIDNLAWRLRESRECLEPALNELAAQTTEDGDVKWVTVTSLSLSRRTLDTVLPREEREGEREGEKRETTTLSSLPTRRGRTVADLVRHVGEVLDAVGAETEQRLAKDDLRKVMVSLVFAYWAKRTGHERTLLDPKRETRLLARLRENGDNVHELLYAVDGYSKDGTLQRLKEERGQAYDGIQTLFRDREMVERLAHHCPGWREGLPHPMAVKYLGQQGQNGPGPSGMAPRADEGVSAAPLSLPGRDRQAQGRQDANGSDTNGGGDG